jgi:hypothetical protein
MIWSDAEDDGGKLWFRQRIEFDDFKTKSAILAHYFNEAAREEELQARREKRSIPAAKARKERERELAEREEQASREVKVEVGEKGIIPVGTMVQDGIEYKGFRYDEITVYLGWNTDKRAFQGKAYLSAGSYYPTRVVNWLQIDVLYTFENTRRMGQKIKTVTKTYWIDEYQTDRENRTIFYIEDRFAVPGYRWIDYQITRIDYRLGTLYY